MSAVGSSQHQSKQQDTATIVRCGAWLFRHRTLIAVPVALLILVVPAAQPAGMLPVLAGAMMVAFGEAVRLWAVHHIGAISRTRSDRLGPLIDSGPFARVRNPLYLGNILLWVGFALSARLLWLAPVAVILLAFEYHAIVRWEETLLAMRLGDAYRDYSTRVPQWIPRLGGSHSSAVRNNDSLPRLFSWRETLYSERGTLIAIAAGYGLLALKAYQSGARV